jgi:hypothetical protein
MLKSSEWSSPGVGLASSCEAGLARRKVSDEVSRSHHASRFSRSHCTMDELCAHELLVDACAFCAPVPDGLEASVIMVPHGRLFHRTEECHVFMAPRENAKVRTTPIRTSPRAARGDGLGACWVCFPDAPDEYKVPLDRYL